MADPARFELTTSAFGGQRSLARLVRLANGIGRQFSVKEANFRANGEESEFQSTRESGFLAQIETPASVGLGGCGPPQPFRPSLFRWQTRPFREERPFCLLGRRTYSTMRALRRAYSSLEMD